MEFLFDWDENNASKIEAHGLTVEEVEGVIRSPFASPAASDSSGRPILFGWTDSGEYIAAVYEFEDAGDIRVIRVVTAYPVPPPATRTGRRKRR